MKTYDFTVNRGDTFDGITFEILVNSLPLDLTGCSMICQLRHKITSAVALEMELGSGLELVDAPAGKFRFSPQVFTIAASNYLYDVEITLLSGEIKTYLSGTINIKETVTRNE